MKTEEKNGLTLHIFTPQRLFLSGEAQSLVFDTLDGKRGVLKDHMPAVFALDDGILEVLSGGVRTKYATSRGFLEVFDNVVNVYVNVCSEKKESGASEKETDQRSLSDARSLREHRRNAVKLARIVTKK